MKSTVKFLLLCFFIMTFISSCINNEFQSNNPFRNISEKDENPLPKSNEEKINVSSRILNPTEKMPDEKIDMPINKNPEQNMT